MLIAQLTDSHIRPAGALFADVVDTHAMLGRAVDTILALSPKPDVVIFTGDLTNDGEPEAYATLRPILERLPMPVYAIPGNHDDREAMLALDGVAMVGADSAFRHYAVDLGDLRLVALDSNVPGKAHGALCAERKAWLEAELASSGNGPVLMMVHHPPAETGIGFMDRIPLLSDPVLEALISQHAARIQRIVCGHIHRAIFYRWQNVPVSVAPGVAHQVILGLDGQEPAFVMEPPGFHLHQWSAARGLVTHHVAIGSYPGSYQFSGNPDAKPLQPPA